MSQRLHPPHSPGPHVRRLGVVGSVIAVALGSSCSAHATTGCCGPRGQSVTVSATDLAPERRDRRRPRPTWSPVLQWNHRSAHRGPDRDRAAQPASTGDRSCRLRRLERGRAITWKPHRDADGRRPPPRRRAATLAFTVTAVRSTGARRQRDRSRRRCRRHRSPQTITFDPLAGPDVRRRADFDR